MTDESEDDIISDEAHHAALRWIPGVVVTGVLAGFIGLAWYAYHAGTQSVKDEELIVVEADKTPLKEKPLDPGGMQFPNQDKTVFETISGTSQQAKVERVLPGPEEPAPMGTENAPAETWINEKIAKEEPAAEVAKPEPQAGEKQKVELAPPAPVDTDTTSNETGSATESFVANRTKPAEAAPAQTAAKPVTLSDAKPSADKPAGKEKEAVKAEEKQPAKEETKASAKPAGKVQVQLAAFRSEKEAKDAWAKMQKKISELSGRTPSYVRADLGDKGIYYRLRVGGFASEQEAKSFCAKVSAKGQACVIAVK